MEKAIETLQNEIIMLTGQITLTIENEDISELSKSTVISKWYEEIEDLKKAQLTLTLNH